MGVQNITYYFLGNVLIILLENVSLVFGEKSFLWQMMNSLRHNLHLKVTTLPCNDKKHEKGIYKCSHTHIHKKIPICTKKQNKTNPPQTLQ